MVRIEESKRLLTNTDYTIVDIAIAVGFEDQSYFSKVFKKYTGLRRSNFVKHFSFKHTIKTEITEKQPLRIIAPGKQDSHGVVVLLSYTFFRLCTISSRISSTFSNPTENGSYPD